MLLSNDMQAHVELEADPDYRYQMRYHAKCYGMRIGEFISEVRMIAIKNEEEIKKTFKGYCIGIAMQLILNLPRKRKKDLLDFPGDDSPVFTSRVQYDDDRYIKFVTMTQEKIEANYKKRYGPITEHVRGLIQNHMQRIADDPEYKFKEADIRNTVEDYVDMTMIDPWGVLNGVQLFETLTGYMQYLKQMGYKVNEKQLRNAYDQLQEIRKERIEKFMKRFV